jgi:HK97 family phage prohead protease
MLHKTVKATATTTDQGEFTAIAASYSVDRVNERIIPGAFEKTLMAWRTSGKNIPLHWDHQGEASNVIGYIDPAAAQETDQGLYVEGRVDLENSDTAREAWRSMKNNSVALSFGYLPKTRKGKDGVTEITEIDLFEISIVPAPANPDTKLLSLKSYFQEAKARIRAETSAVEDGPSEEPETVKPEPQDPLVTEVLKTIFRA